MHDQSPRTHQPIEIPTDDGEGLLIRPEHQQAMGRRAVSLGLTWANKMSPHGIVGRFLGELSHTNADSGDVLSDSVDTTRPEAPEGIEVYDKDPSFTKDARRHPYSFIDSPLANRGDFKSVLFRADKDAQKKLEKARKLSMRPRFVHRQKP